MTDTLPLLLVGYGKMGACLLTRWLDNRPPGIGECRAVTRQALPGAPAFLSDLESLPAGFMPGVIVLSVKPKQLAELLPLYRARFGNAPLYLSVAAGKTLSFYARHLGSDARVVRAMPNTPSLIGKGMTALCTSPSLPDADRQLATHLMEAVGKTVWLEEAQMDAATALAGCGPAYVFLFAEAMVKAAIGLGLEEATARTLALETLSGGTALAAGSGLSLPQLRQQVASPGGATEAALKVLMQNDALEKLMQEAMRAAAARAADMAKQD